MKLHLIPLILLAPAAMVAAAEPVTPLSSSAAQELGVLEEAFNAHLRHLDTQKDSEQTRRERAQTTECRELIAHFRRTGEVETVSPTLGLSLLHLACIGQQPQLLRDLLAAGADARRESSASLLGEFPKDALGMVLQSPFKGMEGRGVEVTIPMMDMLLDAGADARGRSGARALFLCVHQGKEENLLHLLDHGATPGHQPGVHPQELLLEATRKGWQQAMLRLLPESGVDTPLKGFSLLGHLLCEMQMREELFEAHAACVHLLLQRGANPQAIDWSQDLMRGHSVADLIHAQPKLRDWLRARGVELPHTPRRLRPAHLTRDLAKLPYQAHPPVQDILERWDALVSQLTEPDSRQKYANQAIPTRALMLLVQADAARAAKSVMQLPLWQRPASTWTQAELDFSIALDKTPELVLPSDFLLETAERMMQAGDAASQRLAHMLIHWLSRRGKEVEGLVERLCEDARPAIAAAAWSVRLELAGHSNFPHYLYFRAEGMADGERIRRIETLIHRGEEMGHCYDLGRTVRFTGAEEDLSVLLELLRRQGATAEADYIGELVALHRLIWEESSGKSLGDTLQRMKKDAGFEAWRAQEAELLRPERMVPMAFGVELALGRYLWEQFNAKQN